MRRLTRAFAVGAAAALTVVGGATNASAHHGGKIYHGNDYATWGSNGWLTVCDKENDGHGVYAYMTTGTAWLNSASVSGYPPYNRCVQLNANKYGYIVDIQLCEQGVGCSAVKPW